MDGAAGFLSAPRGALNALVDAEAPQAAPAPSKPKSPPPEKMRDLDVKVPPPPRTLPQGAMKTSWYWFTLIASVACLIIVLIYYSGRLYFWLQIIYWISGGLALGLTIWAAVGLLGHYNVLNRVSASAERLRDQRAAAPVGDEKVVYRENILVRGFRALTRLVTLLFLFVWNTFLRLVYIATVTVVRAFILAYDLIYYVTYAAWTLAYYALRISWRIIRWALRTSWKILRVVTYLPIAKGLWRKKLRPSIMGKWNHRVEQHRARAASRLEQKRRLVAADGLDPDKWQADRVARHYFFLPHPKQGRKGLRSWLEDKQKQDYNRRDRWTAYRKGLPVPPRYHSERKKAKMEEKKRRKAEEKAKKRGDRPEKKPSKSPRSRSSTFAKPDGQPVADDK